MLENNLASPLPIHLLLHPAPPLYALIHCSLHTQEMSRPRDPLGETLLLLHTAKNICLLSYLAPPAFKAG